MRKSFLKKIAIATTVLGLTISSLSANQKEWPKEIIFGVIPVAGTSSIEAMWGDIVKYLEKTLEVKVNLKTTSDYTGVITGMTHGHIDAAYIGPNAYVTARERTNVEAIAMEVNYEGVPGYHGLILTRKDSGLKTLEDLKGKVWAFTDPQSTSGTLVPTILFSKEGIDPEKYFSKVIYSGGHQASVLALKAGRVDAISNNDLDFNAGVGKQWEEDEFNIVWKSDLIPGTPIAVRGDLPSSLKAAIKGAFLSYEFPKDSQLPMAGFANAKDSSYDSTRELVEAKKKISK
ncbi:MAG: phosphonate ABC transporter substrate-binding protein [Arcobacteraceae bacterium]